jgi:hypothetical protein
MLASEGSSDSLRAEYDAMRIALLRGLDGVEVLIENLPDGTKSIGFTKQQLQTDVELLLRKVGIPVNRNAMSNDNYLYVNIMAVELPVNGKKSGKFCYNVIVYHNQVVNIVRDPSINTFGVMWHRSQLGYAPSRASAYRRIREIVEILVNMFSNEYLTANPIERTK